MKALKFEIKIKTKDGFTVEGYKRSIKTSVEEIGSDLLEFDCELNSDVLLNGNTSKCVCVVAMQDSDAIPFYQLLFGGMMGIPEDYPYIEIIEIPQDRMEIVEI